MKILDEIDVSEGRIKQTRLNIAIQEDRIADLDNGRQSVMASLDLLVVLEADLASYIVFHKRLLGIAVAEFRREKPVKAVHPRPQRLH